MAISNIWLEYKAELARKAREYRAKNKEKVKEINRRSVIKVRERLKNDPEFRAAYNLRKQNERSLRKQNKSAMRAAMLIDNANPVLSSQHPHDPLKRVLEQELEGQLTARVYIAQTTRLISQKSIADGFNMSVATLRRYNSPEERQLSRQWAADAYQREREEVKGSCECGVAFQEHTRCKDCTILIHTHPLACSTCHKEHGRTRDGIYCDSCRLGDGYEPAVYSGNYDGPGADLDGSLSDSWI